MMAAKGHAGWLIVFSLLVWIASQPASTLAAPQVPPCDEPGWFPRGVELKDHTVFWYDGYYYIAANYVYSEKKFAYGRSTDLCEWEVLEPILAERVPGTWDEMAVWAPYVYEENGVYYLYYTGVTGEFTQSIMLATSTNPTDPNAWEVQGMVFQPNHAGSTWEELQWADCRDPMVVKAGGVYYLYYSAYDVEGGIIGVATANSPNGEWMDLGSTIEPIPGTIPESAALFNQDSFFYLFYNIPGQAETYRIGPTSTGPWMDAELIGPGWAHEVWTGIDDIRYTSFLRVYSISISPLIWIPDSYPPRPFIGNEYYRTLIPIAMR
jgi:hypothetical protein